MRLLHGIRNDAGGGNMENYKKIAKSIRLYHLMVSLVCGVIANVIMFAVIFLTGNSSQLMWGAAVAAGIFIVFVLIGMMNAVKACGRIHHRIRSCEGKTAMEAENFIPCAKELAYGNEWLVYHHDNTYLFWTKKNIHEIRVLSQKKNHYQIAVYSTLHPEGERISCTGTEEDLNGLKQWMASSSAM